jgi:hypothetical protein
VEGVGPGAEVAHHGGVPGPVRDGRAPSARSRRLPVPWPARAADPSRRRAAHHRGPGSTRPSKPERRRHRTCLPQRCVAETAAPVPRRCRGSGPTLRAAARLPRVLRLHLPAGYIDGGCVGTRPGVARRRTESVQEERRHGQSGPVLLLAVAVAQSRRGKAGPHSLERVQERPDPATSRRATPEHRMSREISYPTLRNALAASPGVCATATAQSGSRFLATRI